MQIALVVVLGGDLVRSTEHVGIGLITSCLRSSGFPVTVYEVSTTESLNDEEELLASGYNMVGFSTSCINMADVLEMARRLKLRNPQTHIVLGGHMATFWGEKILTQYSAVDSIAYGEGELTIVELAETLQRGGSLARIQSLIYRDGSGVVVRNEVRPLIEDLDTLPLADRDQLELHDHSFQYLRISSSRGCLGRCGFCSSFVGRCQPGPAWRGRSPKLVVDEIEGLVKKYDFHTYDFVDSTFEDPGRVGKRRIGTIAQEIVDRGLEIFYNCCFRAENWNDTTEDRELLDLLIRSGLEKVNIGFESGNQRSLTILNKRASIEDNQHALRLLADFPDIYITFGFIMLHPYSTTQDLQDNADFLFGTGIGQVIRHYFWQLEVYPGTLLEEMMIRDQLLRSDYSIRDGMYKYRFVYPEMEDIAKVFRQYLTVQSVWDFEIFDILIHTFITRLRRKYKGMGVFDEIMEFSAFVQNIRTEMATFNYRFFCRLLQGEIEDHEAEMNIIDCFIQDKINMVKDQQYKLGMSLLRQGYSLVER